MSQTSMTKADKKAKKNELRDTIVVIVEALIIALVFRTFLYQPFSIPTASMQSTLMIGDYFVANKWAWGLGKYSFPLPVPFNGRILAIGEPQRGDIAVFHNEPTGDDYIKRVIGLPGDRIQMKEGRLYINGTEVPREKVGTGVDKDSNESPVPVVLYNETLPNGVSYRVLDFGTRWADDTPPRVVPDGMLFVMGDNRDNSMDSRYPAAEGQGVGLVPQDNLEGKAAIMVWSTDGSVRWYEPWTWFTATRWSRIGGRL